MRTSLNQNHKESVEINENNKDDKKREKTNKYLTDVDFVGEIENLYFYLKKIY